METTLIKTKTRNLVKEFSDATLTHNFEKLGELLSDDGEFQIPDKDGKSKDVIKSEFLEWYKTRMLSTPITKVEHDQCINCQFGKPVVLFNEGSFPRTMDHQFQLMKTGLVISIREEKIIEIGFCYTFLKNENRYGSDCMKDLMKAEGIPYEEARFRVTGIKRVVSPESKYFDAEGNLIQIPVK